MPDLSALKEGLAGNANMIVGEEHTAPRIGSGRVHVLATPVMINLMEAAALDAIERLLPAGPPEPRHASQCRALCGDAGRHGLRASAVVTKVEGARSNSASRRSTTRSASATERTRGSW
jgi:hypothetical protein